MKRRGFFAALTAALVAPRAVKLTEGGWPPMDDGDYVMRPYPIPGGTRETFFGIDRTVNIQGLRAWLPEPSGSLTADIDVAMNNVIDAMDRDHWGNE